VPSSPLPPDAIRERLGRVPAWSLEGKAIERTVRFPTFRAAIAFVNRLADAAEARDHHPDIHVHYREVRLVSWSHDAGGLTERDFALAEEIDALLR
jgi:4a-hydroxytetrahydrobiopterin dehydratase